jgi:hypothetical protein
MRVVYKHTRFLDDEVQFKAFAYGGLSELEAGAKDKEPLLSCRMSTQVYLHIYIYYNSYNRYIDVYLRSPGSAVASAPRYTCIYI